MLSQGLRYGAQRLKTRAASRPLATGLIRRLSSTNVLSVGRGVWCPASRPLGGPPRQRGLRKFASVAKSPTIKSENQTNALFKKLFLWSVPATALGGYGFFYWYTQERQEVKIQKAVLDPNLREKLEDMKPAEESVHPYSSASWLWKIWFMFCRTLKLAWIWSPVIVLSPIIVMSGNEDWRKYLVELLVRTTKRAGCSFVKFGQWVSMRPDIFAADIVSAMKHLMTDAPAHSYEETRRIIKEAFGLSIEELFDSFDETPVASGSVAQVHRATLRAHQSPSGKAIEVAVKVLHPATLDETYIDIQIMTWVMKYLPLVTAPLSGRDFAKNISRQTDCRWEAYNLSRFQCNFIDEIANQTLRVPQVVTGLVRPSILVETWDDGRLISNAFEQDTSPTHLTTDMTAARDGGPAVSMKVRKQLATRLFDTSLKMFLRDNFIHADLHAGNIMFDSRPSKVPGSKNKVQSLTLLDAGLTAQLDEQTQPVFNTFLIAMCRMEAETISECLVKFNKHKENRPRTEQQMRKLVATVQSIIDEYSDENGKSRIDGGPVNVGWVMGGILHRLPDHHIKLKGDVAFSVCVISLIEGLIRQLNPSFDMFAEAMPYFHKYKLIDTIQLVEQRVEDKKQRRKHAAKLANGVAALAVNA